MGLIVEEETRKKCGKKTQMKPFIKQFTNIVSKIDTGVKKSKQTVKARQSNDLTAKKKDELFGRVSGELVAKFLTSKITQNQFTKMVKKD